MVSQTEAKRQELIGEVAEFSLNVQLNMFLLECVSNVDDILGELFLEEKVPTEEDINV